MSIVIKHEYKIKVFSEDERVRGTIEASLNVLGAEGWRVVSTAIESPTTFSSAAFVVTLERPVA